MILVFSKEINDAPNVPKILKVLLVSVMISLTAIPIDFPRGNLMC